MTNSQKRNCDECPFGTTDICELSGDRANKRNCIPSIRYPKSLKQWVSEHPEEPISL